MTGVIPSWVSTLMNTETAPVPEDTRAFLYVMVLRFRNHSYYTRSVLVYFTGSEDDLKEEFDCKEDSAAAI